MKPLLVHLGAAELSSELPDWPISEPSESLAEVNQIRHLNNACTDDVQIWLDNGWRILAICGQASQRRPDYILGRKR